MNTLVPTTASAHSNRLIVAVACVTTCLAVSSVYVMQPVMAEIAYRFSVSASDARLAFSVVSVTYALAFFLLGPLSDRLDPRVLSAVGLLAAACCTGAGSFVTEYRQLLVLLAVQGAFAAMPPAAMFALMPRIARKESMGTYFGFVIAASVVGITLGRSSMGLLTAQWGFASAMRICGLSLLAAAALNCILPASASANRHSIAAAYGNALKMLCTPQLLRLLSIGFFLFFGYLGVLTFLTLRLHEAPFAFDSAAIGRVSLLGLSAVFGAPVSGRLVTRFGSLHVALCGMTVVLAAIACLATAASTGVLVLGLFLLFLGVFSCQPAVFVRITTRVDVAQRGAASSLYLLTCLGAGSVASAGLGGLWNTQGWWAVCACGAGSVFLGMCVALIDACLDRLKVARRCGAD